MQRWIVKAGKWESRPLEMREAALLAERLVDASDSFADVTIEFSHELMPPEVQRTDAPCVFDYSGEGR